MRPKKLVPGETIEIDTESLHVDRSVRRIRDGIDTQQRAGDLVYGLRDGRNVRDAAEDIRGVCARDKSRLFREQFLKIRGK